MAPVRRALGRVVRRVAPHPRRWPRPFCLRGEPVHADDPVGCQVVHVGRLPHVDLDELRAAGVCPPVVRGPRRGDFFPCTSRGSMLGERLGEGEVVDVRSWRRIGAHQSIIRTVGVGRPFCDVNVECGTGDGNIRTESASTDTLGPRRHT